MIARATVVDEARSWIGTRWVHQGRSRDGIDCAGLIVMVCRALTISDYDAVSGYPRDPDGSFMQHFFALGGKRIPILTALPGDIMLFRDSIFACHCGFVADKDGAPSIVHAFTSRRKVLEEPLIGEFRDKWVATFALPGVG